MSNNQPKPNEEPTAQPATSSPAPAPASASVAAPVPATVPVPVPAPAPVAGGKVHTYEKQSVGKDGATERAGLGGQGQPVKL